MRKIISLLYRIYHFARKRPQPLSSHRPYNLQYSPSGSPVKIFHVNGNFEVGGTTQLMVDIIERTSDKYTHTVIVPWHPEPVPYQPVTIRKFPISEMTQLFEFLRDEKPALVHIQYWVREKDTYVELALWYAAIFRMCNELKIKVIQNVNVPTRPYRAADIAHNVFVSKYVIDNYNADSSTASSVIYPGSDFSHFTNHDVQALPGNSIGMVYRLDHDKLNPEAIEVFILAVRKRKDLLCYIVGGGEYFDWYKQRVSEEKLEKNFVFTGIISYSLLPEYYKKFSVFVAPVHNESFGQVTPFAMSMGLCIAGYDTGALSEILGNKDSLVPYGNREELVNVIIDLLDHPDKRAQTGKKNQERASAYFSVESMIRKYENLYAVNL